MEVIFRSSRCPSFGIAPNQSAKHILRATQLPQPVEMLRKSLMRLKIVLDRARALMS